MVSGSPASACGDEGRDHPAVVGSHPGTVGVEDPGDRGVGGAAAPVGLGERLRVPLAFVVDAARADGVDVPDVLLDLRMHQRIAVDLAGGGEDEAGAVPLGQLQAVLGAERSGPERLDRQPVVGPRGGGRGQMEHHVEAVELRPGLQRTGDVVVDQVEVGAPDRGARCCPDRRCRSCRRRRRRSRRRATRRTGGTPRTRPHRTPPHGGTASGPVAHVSPPNRAVDVAAASRRHPRLGLVQSDRAGGDLVPRVELRTRSSGGPAVAHAGSRVGAQFREHRGQAPSGPAAGRADRCPGRPPCRAIRRRRSTTTGTPQAIASSGTIPNGSYQGGADHDVGRSAAGPAAAPAAPDRAAAPGPRRPTAPPGPAVAPPPGRRPSEPAPAPRR